MSREIYERQHARMIAIAHTGDEKVAEPPPQILLFQLAHILQKLQSSYKGSAKRSAGIRHRAGLQHG
jgi:hypothetical protein